jgi:2-oxoglutarate dehydrogenase E1 component
LEKFSYLNRPNLEFIEGLYQSFRENPEAVEPEWKLFFQGVEFAQNLSGKAGLSTQELDVFRLINSFRDYGHFEANLNPLASAINHFQNFPF